MSERPTFDERFDALAVIAYRVAYRLLGQRQDTDPRVAVPEPSLELPADKLVGAPQGLMATPAAGHREGDRVIVHLDPGGRA